jgi:hypothetical protein
MGPSPVSRRLRIKNDLPHRERIAQLRSGDRSRSHFNEEIVRLLRSSAT